DFYTYVGGPAINALKRWLKTREKMKANRPEEFPSSIFVGNWYTPIDERNISEYWLKQLKRLGLYESTSPKSNGQRSGMNVHLIRGIFKTQWEKSRAYLPIAESFMGHLVDALDYSRVMDDKEWVLGEYLKALSYLDVSHDDPSLQASTVRELNSKLSDQDEKIKAQDKQIKDLQEYTKLVKPLLNMALLNQTGITPILSPEEAEKIKKSLLLDKEKGER
ncbi:MAG: hypothetical protein NTY03_04350, partial [Candidatus Bathyarchaeota archaeon]|nr:hypothetical protein [Candidatus Bathyarchaeota archaeon]